MRPLLLFLTPVFLNAAVTITASGGHSYLFGQPQQITVTISDPGATHFGFELSSTAGDLTPSSDGLTQLSSHGIRHSAAAFEQPHNGSFSYTFTWTPPSAGVGSITFHASGTTSAHRYTTSLELFPNVAPAAASSISLRTNSNPANLGAPLNLIATVAPSSATGSVAFYDGVNFVGSAGLSSGQAVLATGLLPPGNRSLKAYYSGDANNQPSFSAVVPQTITSLAVNTFLSRTVNSGSTATFVSVADFNNDGKPDLLTATNSSGFSVYLGNGDGTFRSPLNFTASFGGPQPVIADFNGDGKMDIAFEADNASDIQILLGNGDGTFQNGFTISLVSFSINFVNGMVVGDFNGDGKPDIAFTGGLAIGGLNPSASFSVNIALNDGRGNFPTVTSIPISIAVGPVNVGDFNNDGITDLSINGGNVMVGRGDGTFSVPASFTAVSPLFTTAGDFNGDGKTDIAASTSNTLFLYPGNGNSTFQSAMTSPLQGLPELATFDFNADGKLDLVASANGIDILYGNGDGSFQTPVPVAGGLINSVAIADFNNDGRPDIVVAGDSGLVVMMGLFGQSSGTQLKFVSQPPNGLVNSPLPPVTVQIQDAGGNLVPSFSATVTVTSTPSGASQTVAAVNGIATFNNLVFGNAGVYSLTALSTGLASATSSNFSVVAAGPSVVIDTPTNGATILNGSVNVTGWAIDNMSAPGTAISSVQVKVDGVVVGNASYGISRTDVCAAFPNRPGCPNVGYTFTLNASSIAPGTHTLTVTATDSDGSGDSGSASVSINVSMPPAVFIDTPGSGATLSGTVMVSGWAVDNSAGPGTPISSVAIKIDNNVVGNATYGMLRGDVCNAFPNRPNCPNVGFTYSLDTTKLSPGPHTLTATATDTDQHPDSGSWSVPIQVNGASTVVIDTPSANSNNGSTINVTGWALGVIAPPSSVQVKVDGNLAAVATYGIPRPDVCAAFPGRPACPNVGYSAQVTLASGTHTITVVADGSSASVTISVNSPPPMVFVDSIANGATVSGTVQVSGWAIDTLTPIGSVQIKVDGNVAGTATYGTTRGDVCQAFPGRPGCPNVGFTFQLNTNTLSAGQHTIMAVATDMDASPQSGTYSFTVFH